MPVGNFITVDRFVNLADAGAQLGAALTAKRGLDDALMLAAIPNGVPVALAAAPAISAAVVGLPVTRDDDGVIVDISGLQGRLAAVGIPDLTGRTVLIVDDGVETGTLARAVAAPLRALGPARLVLAVPVCSREAMAHLSQHYDDVVAVHTPLGRRALSWHFEDFDRIDKVTAERMLAG